MRNYFHSVEWVVRWAGIIGMNPGALEVELRGWDGELAEWLKAAVC